MARANVVHGGSCLAVNPQTQEIEAETLTENGAHDADQVDDLLEQINPPVDAFYGDGAYDQWKVYGTLETEKIRAIHSSASQREDQAARQFEQTASGARAMLHRAAA